MGHSDRIVEYARASDACVARNNADDGHMARRKPLCRLDGRVGGVRVFRLPAPHPSYLTLFTNNSSMPQCRI